VSRSRYAPRKPSAAVFPPPVPNEEALLSANRGLIYRIAAPFLRNIPGHSEDLMQEALIGALRAIRTHDPARAKLSTWMLLHVKGACIEFCREKMRLVQIGRTMDRLLPRLQRAEIDPFACLCDEDRLQHAACRLGIDPERLRMSLMEYDRSQHLTSLDLREAAVGALPAAPETFDRDAWIDLCAAWKTLSPKRQAALWEHASGWSFPEIADRWGCSASNVGLIHSRGVTQLRAQIAAASEGH
jgi:RNA polymerase sigma factor (sigma-70 family)